MPASLGVSRLGKLGAEVFQSARVAMRGRLCGPMRARCAVGWGGLSCAGRFAAVRARAW